MVNILVRLSLPKNKKIWNLSLKKWDVIEEDKIHYYKFGLESDGTANVEIIDGSLLLNSSGSGCFSIVHDPVSYTHLRAHET